MEYKIVNVIATANLNQPINLEQVGKLDNVLYDVNIYFCAYFRDIQMNCKVSVFKTGKMISIGTKTPEQAVYDLEYVTEKLVQARLIKPVKIKTKVQNIVATTDFGVPINLERISQTIKSVIYEPDQFTGAIWRPKNFNATILIFASGKLVIVGVKSMDEYNAIPSFLKDKLKLFYLTR